MSEYPWPNLAAMFFDQATRLAERPLFWAKSDGQWRAWSWRESADQVNALAAGLRTLGVSDGDRVALVSENRPEWGIADLAIMTAGAITAPGYVTNTVEDHRHLFDDSGAVGAVVSTARLARPLLAAAREARGVRFVIVLEPPSATPDDGPEVLTWREVAERGRVAGDPLANRVGTLSPESTACLIYTSGTGGLPKGVMTPHRAILHNCMGARHALEELGLDDEVFLSFLPLSHSYEHSTGLFFPISIGAQIYYAEGIDQLGRNMVEARPTIMTAVPRLYETMMQRIESGLKKSGGAKERLFRRTLELGGKRHADDRLALHERLQDAVLDRLVRGKVRANFGGRLKALVSGGGPLNPDVGLYFTALGLRLLQGYGQTESGPVISVNRPRRNRIHTVGPPILNTEVRLAEDGEILVRGDLVMQGYWGNPEATAEALRDGWLHTGDVGEIDDDGYIRITDRKKDIIVLSGGDNVAPQRVEGLLTLQPEISQAMVRGDRRPHLVALLVPDAGWLATWADARGTEPDLAELAGDPDLNTALGEVVGRVNGRLSTIERVRRFVIADAPFSIENGQMTPTMKVRRHVVRQVYAERLDALYT